MKPTALFHALFAMSLLWLTHPLSAAENPRPNVLVLMADDWSSPHAGVLGDKVCKTPTFDRLAQEGVLFTQSYCAAPSCSASRAATLTGRWPHELESGVNLWSHLPAKFATYPDQLEKAGYFVGLHGKGYGPGSIEGRTRNPAGPNFPSFAAFLKSAPADKPFCFWFGSHDPHRPYVLGSGVKSGMKLEAVQVPAWLPDTPEVRGDICDYYFAVQRFDRDCGEILKLLEETGRLDNTLVIMTSDNGMPFPRAKANLYDSGCHMPLAIRLPAKRNAGTRVDAFASHTDLAPTILETVGLKPEQPMSGHSLLPSIAAAEDKNAKAALGNHTFFERERHANVRVGDLGYPCRAIRTGQFLYVRNLRPDRWPAGDPQKWVAVGPYGDIDGGPTKDVVVNGKDNVKIYDFFKLACERRPPDELYDLSKDPKQQIDVANNPEYAETRKKLSAELEAWMKATNDPRKDGGGDEIEKYPYLGDKPPAGGKPKKP